MSLPTDVMDGYIRVSVVGGRQGDRFQSPDAQREAIAGWANLHGVRIGAWHEDLDRSGGTMDRPGIQAIRDRIDREETGGIIVARLDRFARTLVGGLVTIQELHAQGARVVSVSESLDPATPMGRAMLGLLLLMGEWHRDQADEHLASAQSRAASAGRFPGRPGYGYVRAADGSTTLHPDEAPVYERILRERAAGRGFREIARGLDADGVPTRLGRGSWGRGTLAGLVKSEAPLGVFVGPRGLRVEGAWPAIIDRETWARANAAKSTPANREPIHQDRLVAGIARCAECRYTMSRTVNPHGFVSYGCTRSECTVRPSMGAHLVDEHVRAAIDSRMNGHGGKASSPTDATEGMRLRTATVAAQGELDQWVNDLEIRRALGEKDWRAGILARATARDAAATELAQWEATHDLEQIATGEAAFRLEAMTWEGQRAVVKRALHSVWVRKSPARGEAARRHVADRLLVVWRNDPAPPELPSSTRRGDPLPAVRW